MCHCCFHRLAIPPTGAVEVLNAITFLRRGVLVSHKVANPMQTVLDYLRLEEKSKGTKEGCNEGDCGACTVAIGHVRDGRLVYEPANACIMLMGHLHGKELVTVDDLAKGDVLHPVQQAMVEAHASQCGFCTPGFVMSLYVLFQQQRDVTRQEVVDAIAGNLCRCTGYRPIVDAALKACNDTQFRRVREDRNHALEMLSSIAEDDVLAGNEKSFIAVPRSAVSLLSLAAQHPDAVIVSGATDVGLWITKQMRLLPKLIFTHGVSELHAVRDEGNHLHIGAAATYAEVFAALSALHSDAGEVLRRLGSTQVRASGTIGGNIANGSPIGDMPPLLIALGATLVLKSSGGERRMALEEYFIAYGKQDRQPGEIVWSIEVPKLGVGKHFSAFKISKRFDQDISAVMSAFRFTSEGRKISSARIAFGGMAATPKRAVQTEAALVGVSLDDEVQWKIAIAALSADYQPISDMRASASYRTEVAQNLLLKALMVARGDDVLQVGAA
jgi:xanthine dehydrogenase small subunit